MNAKATIVSLKGKRAPRRLAAAAPLAFGPWAFGEYQRIQQNPTKSKFRILITAYGLLITPPPCPTPRAPCLAPPSFKSNQIQANPTLDLFGLWFDSTGYAGHPRLPPPLTAYRSLSLLQCPDRIVPHLFTSVVRNRITENMDEYGQIKAPIFQPTSGLGLLVAPQSHLRDEGGWIFHCSPLTFSQSQSIQVV